MKSLMKVMILICLSSCGYSYEVKEKKNYSECTAKKYQCVSQKPLFFYDSVIAICDTKEECNNICIELRKK